MHLQGHCTDSECVIARFLGRFARTIGTTSFVFRVSVKVIIDRRIDHLIDHPMGRTPITLVHILWTLHPQNGVPIGHVLGKLQSSLDFESIGARK